MAHAVRRVAGAIVFAGAMCASTPSSAPAAPAVSIVVRYPAQGQEIAAFDKSFAIGSAPPGSLVVVNGVRAQIAPDGGWSAFVPLHPGRFVFRVRASKGAWSSEVDRTVMVDDGTLAPFPTATTIVQPGESIRLAISAPDGAVVSADGPGFANVKLAPDTGAGTRAFVADVHVGARAAGPAHVVYHVSNATGRADVDSASTLAISSRAVLYVGDVIPYSPDPGSGYRPYAMLSPSLYADTDFTVPVRTELAVTGRFGNYVRVALPGAPAHFVDRRSLVLDPAKTSMPVAAITSIQRSEDLRTTTIVVHMRGARPPFRVVEEDGALGRIDIFGASRADISLRLPQHAFWGYTTRWSDGDLILTFRKPPPFAAPPHAALRGLHIVVDPGHSPDSGAVGPIGTVERDINLDVASRLAAQLRALGADVTMTRTTDAPVILYDRPALAERLDADVLISVHQNAPPDGTDPALEHGYSVYYFQPQSLALAQSIHQAYHDEIGIPDAGLHSGDLALVRPSAMPAVLTESAFITWPWEEMMLREASFRERLAKAMADGMERWAERMRDLESRQDMHETQM
ncbi:MAG TPA: N-acetylmuramoyl-L-alanine amidase [Candidatus Eremiobacteraceae bacterium]